MLLAGANEDEASTVGSADIRNSAVGEFDGVGCLDRCSSSSGIGDGIGFECGHFPCPWDFTASFGLGPSTSSHACGVAVPAPTVDTLAVSVDEPETELGGELARDFVFSASSSTAATRLGEYPCRSSPPLPLLRTGEPTTFGGLKLSASLRPVRSRPLRSSSLPVRLPPEGRRSNESRSRSSRPHRGFCPYAFPSPTALPVGLMLPIGEPAPGPPRERLRERESASENDEFLVDERPREPERESLEREYEYDDEPVVVEPETDGGVGMRPRVGRCMPSGGERWFGSEGHGLWMMADCPGKTATRGTGTAAVTVAGIGGDGGERLLSSGNERGANAFGLLSRDRSVRSSIAPFASFTTTTTGVPLLLPLVTLSAPQGCP